MKRVSSKVVLNHSVINRLSKSAIRALEKTGKALHTEVVQAEIMPRDTGAMQNEFTFVDCSKSKFGKVFLATATPYARRMYFHPEYDFQKWENAFSQGKWLEPWMPQGIYADFAQKAYNNFFKKEAGI